jgi:hypothetical protein
MKNDMVTYVIIGAAALVILYAVNQTAANVSAGAEQAENDVGTGLGNAADNAGTAIGIGGAIALVALVLL